MLTELQGHIVTKLALHAIDLPLWPPEPKAQTKRQHSQLHGFNNSRGSGVAMSGRTNIQTAAPKTLPPVCISTLFFSAFSLLFPVSASQRAPRKDECSDVAAHCRGLVWLALNAYSCLGKRTADLIAPSYNQYSCDVQKE